MSAEPLWMPPPDSRIDVTKIRYTDDGRIDMKNANPETVASLFLFAREKAGAMITPETIDAFFNTAMPEYAHFRDEVQTLLLGSDRGFLWEGK